MTVKILELAGERWAILPEREYKRLAAQARIEDSAPSLPSPDADGNYPAVEYAHASLARKIVRLRRAAGLSRAELARRAGIRLDILGPIENGKTTPDAATIAKIERALRQ
ncbi:MAG: helix-turn-helix transcriptional regulator [Planctomycetes bacterium]|nr:helix-turn-helix transcriptional regulator [Planctomycetota bacterium]MBM4079295.1 helix-turn-helix transcriptional regulator [Planctomycetota bacterium]